VDASDEATDVQPRYPGDRYYQTSTRQTWQWVASTETEAGYWDVAAEPDLLVVGVESPAVQHYPALVDNDVLRRFESVSVQNFNADGTLATAGVADVVVDGSTATPGTTLVDPNDYVLLNVTDTGTGLLLATIELRQI
jgi:hypothetical protein